MSSLPLRADGASAPIGQLDTAARWLQKLSRLRPTGYTHALHSTGSVVRAQPSPTSLGGRWSRLGALRDLLTLEQDTTLQGRVSRRLPEMFTRFDLSTLVQCDQQLSTARLDGTRRTN
jgi:hypothetical protein